MKRSQFDVRHPIFRPLWRRVVLVVLAAAWTTYEIVNANWVWAGVFTTATAYLFYEWFFAFDPADYEDKE